MDAESAARFHAESHDIIDDEQFESVEQYVLHLMHVADYERAQRILKGKTVLDLGCNSGYGSHLLSRSATLVTGVDVSANAIALAVRRHGSENLRFRVIDGVDLPFEENSFDIVTSFQVIEHIVDYEAYFAEIRRVLKPNGMAIFTTPNAEIRVRPGEKPWNPFHVHEFRGSELASFLSQYFSAVDVLGQFAEKELYSIEYARCISARDRTREPARPNLKQQVSKVLPLPIRRALVTARDKIFPRPRSALPNQVRERFSVNDLFYQRSELERALTLVACCSGSQAAQQEASGAFLGV